MNTTVQTTGGDASSLSGKSESPNKTLANITRALLLNSSHKKELWCFAYQYAIWLSRRTENRLRGGVPYFLWHGIPTYSLRPAKVRRAIGLAILNIAQQIHGCFQH